MSIYNLIRALTLPFPGAFTHWNGEKIIIWEAGLLKGYRLRFNAQPGEILDIMDNKGIVVATGDNGILIKTVEVGGQTVSGAEFMRRLNVAPGTILGENKHGKSIGSRTSSR